MAKNRDTSLHLTYTHAMRQPPHAALRGRTTAAPPPPGPAGECEPTSTAHLVGPVLSLGSILKLILTPVPVLLIAALGAIGWFRHIGVPPTLWLDLRYWLSDVSGHNLMVMVALAVGGCVALGAFMGGGAVYFFLGSRPKAVPAIPMGSRPLPTPPSIFPGPADTLTRDVHALLRVLEGDWTTAPVRERMAHQLSGATTYFQQHPLVVSELGRTANLLFGDWDDDTVEAQLARLGRMLRGLLV